MKSQQLLLGTAAPSPRYTLPVRPGYPYGEVEAVRRRRLAHHYRAKGHEASGIALPDLSLRRAIPRPQRRTPPV